MSQADGIHVRAASARRTAAPLTRHRPGAIPRPDPSGFYFFSVRTATQTKNRTVPARKSPNASFSMPLMLPPLLGVGAVPSCEPDEARERRRPERTELYVRIADDRER